MHRNSPLDLGPRVSHVWMVALLGIRPHTPPPWPPAGARNTLGQRISHFQSEFLLLAGRWTIHLGILAMFLSCLSFGRCMFCLVSERADPAHAKHVLADHACREVQEWSGLGYQEPWVDLLAEVSGLVGSTC